MSQTALEALQAAWPQRIALRADEVALVLRGKQTRRVVERVRNKIKDGSYGGTKRKIDGLWQLPLRDLAELIEPTPSAPPIPMDDRLPPKRSRRRCAIGPRIEFVQQVSFWAPIFRQLGEVEAAEELDIEAYEILRGLREVAQQGRAKRSREEFIKVLNLSDRPAGGSRSDL